MTDNRDPATKDLTEPLVGVQGHQTASDGASPIHADPHFSADDHP